MLRDNWRAQRADGRPRGSSSALWSSQSRTNGGMLSRPNEVPIIALKRSWRQIVDWKTEQPTEKAKWPGFAVTTAAHDSRAVGTAWHQSHRTIDPPMPQKIPAPKGRNLCTNGERRSPFHAEPRHYQEVDVRAVSHFGRSPSLVGSEL